jgi:hypothetical protein
MTIDKRWSRLPSLAGGVTVAVVPAPRMRRRRRHEEKKTSVLSIDPDCERAGLLPEWFATLPLDRRRGFLFALLGRQVTGQETQDRFKHKGYDQARVRILLAITLRSFPNTAKEAARLATEAKGLWKQLTGETYGEKKAETWCADKPACDLTQLNVANH